ncbi:hypothetical protein A33M_2985 [Rhodovulum sp. PH10]|nr:hypothetical protein A33M_2985 [Rhodovulum sp. PH10]
MRQLGDAAVGLLRLLDGLAGDPARLLHLAADLLHRGGHLVGSGGDALHVGGSELGSGRDGVGEPLRHLGGAGEGAGGGLELGRGGRHRLDDLADRRLEAVGELQHAAAALRLGPRLSLGALRDHVLEVVAHLAQRGRERADLVLLVDVELAAEIALGDRRGERRALADRQGDGAGGEPDQHDRTDRDREADHELPQRRRAGAGGEVRRQGVRLGEHHVLRHLDQHRPRLAGSAEGDRRERAEHLRLLVELDRLGALLDVLEVGLPSLVEGRHRLADQVGVLAVGDHQAHVAEDRHLALAAVQLLVDGAGELLHEVEIEVGAGEAAELSVDLHRDREGGEIDALALHDVGQGAEHALLGAFLQADVPAALHHAVRMQRAAVVLDERLQRDLAVLGACPVGQEAAGVVGADVAAVLELTVAAVERSRLPGRVGAVERGISLQHVEQDLVDLVAPRGDRRRLASLRREHAERLRHGARRDQRGGELLLHRARLAAGDELQGLATGLVHQRRHGVVDEAVVPGRRQHAVADQDTGGADQTDAREGGDLRLDGFGDGGGHSHVLSLGLVLRGSSSGGIDRVDIDSKDERKVAGARWRSMSK